MEPWAGGKCKEDFFAFAMPLSAGLSSDIVYGRYVIAKSSLSRGDCHHHNVGAGGGPSLARAEGM